MLGVLLALILTPKAFGQQVKLGDACQLGVESIGTCTKLSNCPTAQDKVFCDVGNNIVCCPEVPQYRPVCEGRSGGRQKRKLPGTDYVHGGELAKSQEFPHVVALGYDSYGEITWECGGALITPTFVLTAAHCLSDPRNPGRTAQWVRVGDLDLKDNSDDQGTQTVAILDRIPHPQYVPRVLHHDIALLELEEPIQIVPGRVETSCVQVSRSIPNLKPIIAGWGETEEGRLRKGQKLMKAELDFQPMDKCVQVTSRFSLSYVDRVLPNGLKDESMVCAGKLEGGVDSCKGDSGGPLQVRVNATNCIYNVVAVTSFGYKCGLAETPAIYTRVSQYIPWIESVVCSSNE